MIVVIGEGFDLVVQITWKDVFLQQNAVFQSLMPSFNFALDLRVIWCAANVIHAFVIMPFGQFTRDLTGTIIHCPAVVCLQTMRGAE